MMKQLWEAATGPERKALVVEMGLREGDVCFQRDVKSHFICVSMEPLKWEPFYGELAAFQPASLPASEMVCGYCAGVGGGLIGPVCPRCGKARG